MMRPQDDERRRAVRGRRESDGLLERDIAELRRAFSRLEREVGPVEGQVAKVDGSLQAVEATLRGIERTIAGLEAWLADERTARRHHDAELDEEVKSLRDYFQSELKALRDWSSTKFGECMTAIGGLGADGRAGRRTILVAIITTAGVILAAYLTKGGK